MITKKPYLVGITGGIGAGKSTICQIFATLGVPIYEADARAKWLMTQHLPLIEAIKQTFGQEAYLEDGQLNRTYLAAQVFNDGNKVKLLNHLVHPTVGKDFEDWVAVNAQVSYVLNEAALMFESGRYLTLDKVITVYAPEALRTRRTQHRDKHRSPAEIKAIMSKQLSEEEKIKRADYVIYNDDVQLVLPQVLKLHQYFITQSKL